MLRWLFPRRKRVTPDERRRHRQQLRSIASIGRRGGKARVAVLRAPPSSGNSIERPTPPSLATPWLASGRRSIALRGLGFDSAVEMKIPLYLPEALSDRPSLTPLFNALLSQSGILLTISAAIFHTAPLRP